MPGRFGMIMPVLSGRFVAPASFTTGYHEEKATQKVETLPYIASSIAQRSNRNSSFGDYETTSSERRCPRGRGPDSRSHNRPPRHELSPGRGDSHGGNRAADARGVVAVS